MVGTTVALNLRRLQLSVDPLVRFLQDSSWARQQATPGVIDLAFAGSHTPPLAPTDPILARGGGGPSTHWFAAVQPAMPARAAVAAGLRHRRGQAFETADISLTAGAMAALAMALRAIVEPGDEVIYLSPAGPLYAALITAAGARPVRVRLRPADFSLDLPAIGAALTPRTRALIINSPHNPTGRIYPAASLAQLAGLLAGASMVAGRPCYLLSDESDSRLVFDGQDYASPTAFYPHSCLLYGYGSTLLSPGRQLGYLALPPTLPAAERRPLREALLVAQLVSGGACPDATLQQALPELEALAIDIGPLQRKRDSLVTALRGLGYAVHAPEGGRFLLPRAPLADDRAVCETLAAHDLLALPGSLLEAPGYLRLALTAGEDRLTRALPALAAAMEPVRRTS